MSNQLKERGLRGILTGQQRPKSTNCTLDLWATFLCILPPTSLSVCWLSSLMFQYEPITDLQYALGMVLSNA